MAINYINECYQYTIEVCGQSYTLNTAYVVEGKGANSLILHPPIDPTNECLSAISWPLGLVYVENFILTGTDCWVLYDFDNTALMYIESGSTSFPNDPFSSWTVIPETDGELFTDFNVQQLSCPPNSCGCSLIFTGAKEGTDPIVNGEEVGVFNGKSIYLVQVGGTTGDLVVYWSITNNRWQIDYWGAQYGYPEPEPMAYLDSDSLCPVGSWTDGLFTPTGVFQINTFLTNCGGVNDNYSPLPIEDYCCANIAFVGGDEVAQFEMNLDNQVWPEGEFPTYYFTVDTADYAIRYNGVNQSWELWLVGDKPIWLGFTFPSSVPDLCPISSISDWFLTDTGVVQIGKINNATSFTIYSCEEQIDVPEIGNANEENCDPYEPCRNKNLLSKSAMALSKDISSLSKREVFGFKCDDAWENIFMRSLIIDALSCSPYGTYSEEEEQCLIGKLTDKCNC